MRDVDTIVGPPTLLAGNGREQFGGLVRADTAPTQLWHTPRSH
jgi:hypothetical protein